MLKYIDKITYDCVAWDSDKKTFHVLKMGSGSVYYKRSVCSYHLYSALDVICDYNNRLIKANVRFSNFIYE